MNIQAAEYGATHKCPPPTVWPCNQSVCQFNLPKPSCLSRIFCLRPFVYWTTNLVYFISIAKHAHASHYVFKQEYSIEITNVHHMHDDTESWMAAIIVIHLSFLFSVLKHVQDPLPRDFFAFITSVICGIEFVTRSTWCHLSHYPFSCQLLKVI